MVLYVLAGCSDQSGDQPGGSNATRSSTDSAAAGTTVVQEAEETLEATDDPARQEAEASTAEEVTETPLNAEEELAPQGTVVTVDRIVSGDTIQVSPAIEGKRTVRLIGIDAPEAGSDGQPFGDAARAQANSLIGGRKVALEFDEKRTDESNRLLAYVRLPGGDLLNEFMLRAGYAQADITLPNVKYEQQLRAAQDEARETNTGIWALPPEQLCQLSDKGNGIGGGC